MRHKERLQVNASGRDVPSVRSWLKVTHLGYCGRTHADTGCNPRSRRGSWTLQQRDTLSWHTAAHACLALCSSCKRCHHISVSLNFHDCSWFETCPEQHVDVNGFRSGPFHISRGRLASIETTSNYREGEREDAERLELFKMAVRRRQELEADLAYHSQASPTAPRRAFPSFLSRS